MNQVNSRASFLEGMSRTAQTVFILTSHVDAASAAMTVSSVTSVSADPPILSVCVHERNRKALDLLRKGKFSLTMLAASDEELSSQFAHEQAKVHELLTNQDSWRLENRHEQWHYQGGVCTFICKVMVQVTVGTHEVVFGEVLDVTRINNEKALIYQDRGYRS